MAASKSRVASGDLPGEANRKQCWLADGAAGGERCTEVYLGIDLLYCIGPCVLSYVDEGPVSHDQSHDQSHKRSQAAEADVSDWYGPLTAYLTEVRQSLPCPPSSPPPSPPPPLPLQVLQQPPHG